MRFKVTSESSSRRLPPWTFGLLSTALCGVALAASTPESTPAPAAADAGPNVVAASIVHGAIRYDSEYPTIGYADSPSHNAIVRLQERINRGEVRLKFEGPRGYLDSVLKALGIDPSSQTLVYSKTSLQLGLIRAATPRAIYFDDDTYVAWIPGTQFLEIATMDGVLGPVFYTLSNNSPTVVHIDRETSRCLTCHDTWGMTGGGVPRFLFLSTLVGENGESFAGQPGEDTTDRTAIRDRWGGWYVTGKHGTQQHLGNIIMDPEADPADVDHLRRGNLDSVRGLFDSRDYLTETSDIVALLVFEHQAYIGNLMTRANFKSRTLLEKGSSGASVDSSWSSLTPAVQRPLKAMFEPLVQGMLFANAAGLEHEVQSSSGFDKWFHSKAVKDPAGRSLRELDLRTRTFKYPLSYLVYSESFNGLPRAAKDYLYMRFADVLSGRDQSTSFRHISPEEARTVLEILSATKPDFAAAVKARAAQCAEGGCST